MYYYKNKAIGTQGEAKEYILTDRDLVRELIEAYLYDGFDDGYIREWIVDMIADGMAITDECLVDYALSYMEDIWMSAGGWNQVKGDRASLGDFEYENWEEEEE